MDLPSLLVPLTAAWGSNRLIELGRMSDVDANRCKQLNEKGGDGGAWKFVDMVPLSMSTKGGAMVEKQVDLINKLKFHKG